jgi:hypothetical protein
LGASGVVIAHGDADDPCEVLRQLNLVHWVEDVDAYMRACPSAPSSLPERKMLKFALALRGAGATKATAEHILLQVRLNADGPVPSVAKTREMVARAYDPDGAEWRGLLAFLRGGAAQ